MASEIRGAERRFLRLLVTPAVALGAAFYFWPLAQVLWVSFTDPTPGLENYALLGTSPPVQRVLMTTLRICAITTAVTLVLAYVLSYLMTQGGPRTRRWMTLGVVLPLWVSVLVRSFAWIALLRREGVINNALMATGIISHPLPLIWNEFGVCVGMVHMMLPYGVLPLASHMRGIDPALMAAARGMGASPAQAFRRVFLPLSLPGLVGAAVLVAIFSLGFYVTPVLLGGGRTLMVAEYISIQILEVLRWGLGTMLSVALVGAIFLLLGLLSRVMDLRKLFGTT